jgi:uroporphyrin-III C-methyltransferase/precorrin-2 dehydrogenase/sirohydrochlorin ferrochelatase
VTLASLDALQDVAARARIESPAMVIVGEVAALADALSWFGEAPRHWEALRHVA